ncbi:hypothetical protein Sjap_000408 [Stephania japonica]|uniref:RING-type E3 ubiquitin transferase n=1 Tax=Stephania japonica TaxID=461633 RepID=A0AAP0KJK2_9MAGN
MDCVSDTNTQAPKCNTRRHQDGPSSPFYTYVDDGYEVNAKIGILSCRHEFHTDCIKDWLLQNNACPICRRPVLKK